MELNRQSIQAFPKLWLVFFSGLFLFLTVVVHQTGFSAGGNSVQYLPVVQRPFGEHWNLQYEEEGSYYEPIDIIKLADSTFLVAGHYRNFSGGFSGWAMKVDGKGTVIWNKNFNLTNWREQIEKALPTADGGAILVGYLHDGVNFREEGWIIRLNSDGSIAWQKRYSYGSWTAFRSATQADNGDIVVAGSTILVNNNKEVLVMRLTSSGDVVWRYTYGWEEVSESALAVAQTNDGGLIVVGDKPNWFPGDHDIWVLQLNDDGSVVWQKTYDSGGDEFANVVIQTDDGGYIVAGQAYYYKGWVLLLKLTADGSITWQKLVEVGEVGTSLDVRSLQQTVDGHFIVAGSTHTDENMNWVLKFNTNGNLIWSKGHPGDYFNIITAKTVVVEAAPGQYLIAAGSAGSSLPPVGDGGFMYLAKVNSLGEVPGCNAIVPLSMPVTNAGLSATDTAHLPEELSITTLSEVALSQNLFADVNMVCSP